MPGDFAVIRRASSRVSNGDNFSSPAKTARTKRRRTLEASTSSVGASFFLDENRKRNRAGICVREKDAPFESARFVPLYRPSLLYPRSTDSFELLKASGGNRRDRPHLSRGLKRTIAAGFGGTVRVPMLV